MRANFGCTINRIWNYLGRDHAPGKIYKGLWIWLTEVGRPTLLRCHPSMDWDFGLKNKRKSQWNTNIHLLLLPLAGEKVTSSCRSLCYSSSDMMDNKQALLLAILERYLVSNKERNFLVLLPFFGCMKRINCPFDYTFDYICFVLFLSVTWWSLPNTLQFII